MLSRHIPFQTYHPQSRKTDRKTQGLLSVFVCTADIGSSASADIDPKEQEMSRIYKQRVTVDRKGTHYRITVRHPDGSNTEIEVNRSLYAELESMQRDIWRLDRQSRRHCEHRSLSEEEQVLKGAEYTACPEELCLEQLRCEDQRDALIKALLGLSPTQARRILLHSGLGFTYRQIARIDGCSDRAVRYCVALAKQTLQKNLKNLL